MFYLVCGLFGLWSVLICLAGLLCDHFGAKSGVWDGRVVRGVGLWPVLSV